MHSPVGILFKTRSLRCEIRKISSSIRNFAMGNQPPSKILHYNSMTCPFGTMALHLHHAFNDVKPNTRDLHRHHIIPTHPPTKKPKQLNARGSH